MSIPAAATLHDEIKHSGLIANVLKVATTFGVGLLTGMAIGAAAVFVVGTGGLGALVLGAVVGAVFGAVADGVAQSITGKGLDESLTAPIHAAIDKMLPGVVKGLIVTGSPDVRINSKAAARAEADEVQCSDHPSVPRPRIAQGSGNVFINSYPAARVGDKTECGAVLSVNPGRKGNVGIGGGQVTVLEIGDGLPPWLSAVSRYLGYALAVCQAIRGRGALAQRIICFAGNALMGMAADKLVSTTGLSQAVADGLNGLKGHPVHMPSGAKVLNGEHDTDFEMPAAMPLAWVRHYNSLTTRSSGLFGQGWSTLYDMELRLNDADRSDLPSGPRPPDSPHTLIDAAGRAIPMPALAEQQKFVLPQEGMTLACLEGGRHGRYVLQLADGWVVDFGAPGGAPDAPETLRPLLLQDPNDNAHHLAYGADGRLQTLRTSCGQELRLLYDLSQHPSRVTRIDYCNASVVQGAACAVQTLVHYGYDAQGQLTEVRNAAGQPTRCFGYDAAGRMHFQRLPEGLEVHYDWAQVAAGGPTGWRVIGWRTSLGERVRIHYDLQGEAPNASATTYLPTPGDTAATQPASRETWHWDDQHRVTRYTDALGQPWRLQWDGDKRQLAGLTSPLDTTVRLTYDEHGHLHTLTDPLGRVTRTQWHPQWALPLSVQHPDQSRTVYQYDSQGNLCVQEAWGPPPQEPPQEPAPPAPPAPRPLATERWAYDERGHLIAHTDAKGGQRLLAHSPRGLLLRHTDCSQRQTRYGYDPHSPWGALQSVTQADGSRHTFQTDALARPIAHTRPDGSTVRWQWNERGQLAAEADALGHISRYRYNPLGQRTHSTDPLGQTIRQDHSAQGLLLQLTDAAGQTTRFEHDAAGQLITQHAIDGIRTDYHLDALGLPVAVDTRSADGTLAQRIELQRDAAGRLIQKRTAHTRSVYHYSALDQLLTIERFERLPDWGSEPQGERPLDVLGFAYDGLGRLIEERSTQFDYPAAPPGEPPTKTARHRRHSVVRHSHDELGNTIQTVLPQGQTLHYLYYGSGHLHHIHLDGHTISDFERDALHQETLRSQGQLRTHRGRDAMGRVLHQITRLGEVGFEDLRHQDLWHQAGQRRSINRQPNHLIKAYAFDANAELIRRRDPLAGEVHYGYDAIGRIQNASSLPPIRQERYAYEAPSRAELSAALNRDPSAPAQPVLNETFAWDAASNPLPPGAIFNGHTASTSEGYVRHNRVLMHEDKRYQYDGLGRLVHKRIGSHTEQRLSWNEDHQLTEVSTTRQGLTQRVRFTYDALGRRTSKTGDFGTTYFIWSGLRLLQEQVGAKLTTHVYEDQDSYVPLARIEQLDLAQLENVGLDHDYRQQPQNFKPRVYYIHANSAGAPEELTDSDGHVVWQARYQTWGNVALQPQLGRDPNPYALPRFKPEAQTMRMQGQYADNETGLYYNTFRYYDPDVGRFISQDPIGLAGGINLYQYGPNPLGWVDPWGWCSTALGNNMRAAGVNRPANTAAHHIVADTAKRAKVSRDILRKHGIDVDSAVNGVYLPSRMSADFSVPGILHNGRHPNSYIDAVNKRLYRADKLGGKQGVLDELGAIRHELLHAARDSSWSHVL